MSNVRMIHSAAAEAGLALGAVDLLVGAAKVPGAELGRRPDHC